MEIKVELIKENEDGSALVELHMNEESKEKLIEIGFLKLLRDAIDQQKQEETLRERVARWWKRLQATSCNGQGEIRDELGSDIRHQEEQFSASFEPISSSQPAKPKRKYARKAVNGRKAGSKNK